MKIITNNLIIRKFTLDDVHDHFINNNDEHVEKYMSSHYLSDEAKALEEIEGFITNYTKAEVDFHYAVTKDDILIGHVGFGKTDIGDGEFIYEICCAINKDNRRYGYAGEATKAFVAWCKSTFGLEQVHASTDRDNISANKTLLNAGFSLIDRKIGDKDLNVYVG